jgi:hypothetical protein
MVGNKTNSSETDPDMILQAGASSNAAYDIRFKDHLDPGWYSWFEGWIITNLADGEVLLSCKEIDQSGLHGVLNKIRDLNLMLISVKRME